IGVVACLFDILPHVYCCVRVFPKSFRLDESERISRQHFQFRTIEAQQCHRRRTSQKTHVSCVAVIIRKICLLTKGNIMAGFDASGEACFLRTFPKIFRLDNKSESRKKLITGGPYKVNR
ncbi:unnamed protein product, partial [Laminaria digitata]